MKVLHMSAGFPLSFQGGITNYVRSLAEHQHETGNEVWVLCSPDNQGVDFKLYFYKSDKIVPMKWRAPKDKKGLKKIKDFLDREKFDLVHIHMILDIDWDLYEVLIPYTYIVSLHDYYFLCPRIQLLMHDNSLCSGYEKEKCSHCVSLFNTIRLTNAFEYKIVHNTRFKSFRLPEIPQTMTEKRYTKFKRLLENASMLLPVSYRVQEIYENSGIKGNYKVLHIGNITADQYKETFSYNWQKEKIDIAMLGTLSYLKGGDLLLKLAQKIDHSKINVNFYGRSNSYKNRIKEAGIYDYGPYKQSELQNILENTDIGLVLSVWEDNGPQVVMEFLNNHIPVIGTMLGGIPDFVHNGINGILFDPFKEDEFDKVVNHINNITREELYQLTSNITRTTTIAEHCRDIDEVYCEVIKKGAHKLYE